MCYFITEGAGTLQPLITLAGNTSNAVVAVFIVIACVIIIVGVPLAGKYVTLQKSRLEADNGRLEAEQKRDHLLIQVVERNSETYSQVAGVLGGIQALFEANTKHCTSCMTTQLDRFDALYRKQDDGNMMLTRAIVLLEHCPNRARRQGEGIQQ